MNISKTAEAVNLPVKTVRYYADIDLVKPAKRTEKGYRFYDDASIRQLIFVRRARKFGFSINECRELLGLYADNARSSADVKKIATKRLSELEEKQKELNSLRDELANLVNNCHGDDRPDCPIIDSFVCPSKEDV